MRLFFFNQVLLCNKHRLFKRLYDEQIDLGFYLIEPHWFLQKVKRAA